MNSPNPTFEVGQTVTLSASFKTPSPANAPVDPEVVLLTVRTPDGANATFTPTHDSTGMFSLEYVTTQVGYHYFKFTGTGNLNAARGGSFETVQSPAGETPCC